MRTKARFTVASLNMRGFRQTTSDSSAGKWLFVNQLVRDKRIGVLAVQETHLDERRAEMIRDLFGQHLDLFYSADEANATGARGVAFVVNKRIVPARLCTHKVVVPGRALLLNFEWSAGKKISMMNVYGPNDRGESTAFWSRILEANTGRVDVLLGDFNLVESADDRLPQKGDPEAPTASLQNLLRDKQLIDGWRLANAGKRAFTYLQTSTGSQSRIDRIYARRSMEKDLDNWAIMEAGLPTDHKMVTVEVSNQQAPFVGKGRWTMPLHILNDDVACKQMRNLAVEFMAELDGLRDRTESSNPQLVYASFKSKLIAAIRQRTKEKVSKMDKRLRNLRDGLHSVLNPPGAGEQPLSEEALRTAALIQERISVLETKRFDTTRKQVMAKNWSHGETIGKYWLRCNAPL
ncbi:DNase I-like protein, partial [Trametes cingulata]